MAGVKHDALKPSQSGTELLEIVKHSTPANFTGLADEFEDQVVVFEHQQLRAGAKREDYEAWVKGESERLAADDEADFMSLMSIPCGEHHYIQAFRFQNYRAVMHWIRSSARTAWLGNGDALCVERGHDVQQGGLSFLPDSMASAAKVLLAKRQSNSQALMGDEGSAARDKSGLRSGTRHCCAAPASKPKCCGREYVQGPPPLWRNVIVIWAAACSVFIPFAYEVVSHFYKPFLPDVYGGQMESTPGSPCVLDVSVSLTQAQVAAATSGTTQSLNQSLSFDPPCGAKPTKHNVMFWGFLLTVFIVNFIVVYIVVPIFNMMCRPFTHGFPKFAQLGLNVEPFTTLDEGLPCFRPHPRAWEGRVSEAEQRLDQTERRMQRLMRAQIDVRHRHSSRLQRLERAADSGISASDVELGGAKGTGDEERRVRVDTEIREDVAKRIDLEAQAINAAAGDGLSYVIAWTEEPMRAEELLHDISRRAANFTGYKGIIVIAPSGWTKNGMQCFHIFFEFDTAEHLQAWITSDVRRRFLELSAGIFHAKPDASTGTPTLLHDGSINSLFAAGAAQYMSPQGAAIGEDAAAAPFEWHPPTWRMYLAMNVAFTIVGYPLGDLWLLAPDGPLARAKQANGEPLELWMKVLINVIILVIVVVYVGVPVVIYYSAHWLFVPWRKSKNPVIAILQEGFPCCLADGPPPPAPAADESAEDVGANAV